MTATDDPAPIPDPPPLPRLHVWTIVRNAMPIYRRNFVKVLVLTIVVLGGAAVVDIFVGVLAERAQRNAWVYAGSY